VRNIQKPDNIALKETGWEINEEPMISFFSIFDGFKR